jgi:hypothetical protein
MNHRRAKIWTSEDQIIAAIDRTKRLAERKLKKSHELADKAKEKFGECEKLRLELMMPADRTEYQQKSLEAKLSSMEIAAGKAKEKSDLAAKHYHRVMNSTLPRLGEILAAFRTGTFTEIMGEYRGVAIR